MRIYRPGGLVFLTMAVMLSLLSVLLTVLRRIGQLVSASSFVANGSKGDRRLSDTAVPCLQSKRAIASARGQPGRGLAMPHSTHLSATDTALLVIDVQEKLMPMIPGADALIRNIAFLID